MENVKSAKYLGITITPDLNWNKHIAIVNNALGVVKHNFIHMQSKLVLTKS